MQSLQLQGRAPATMLEEAHREKEAEKGCDQCCRFLVSRAVLPGGATLRNKPARVSPSQESAVDIVMCTDPGGGQRHSPGHWVKGKVK
uniref:Uncharacterized protein n=1 Tax=Macaca fascicularis TaxID=9541 RepID=Q9GMT8_MACFA|nr:hypothetical protein [Macaca fascicularis]